MALGPDVEDIRKMNIKEALTELRKEKKRKFNQSVDLIVNLKGVDIKRDNIATVVTLPFKIKDKKICAFLTRKSEVIKTILEPDFQRYKDPQLLKKLVSEYDFFIASMKLMPKVATTFGKVLGPAGKMPSPQLGILTDDSDEEIKRLLNKISTSIKIRAKEPSIKVSIGKEAMKDEEIVANAESVYKGVISVLPVKNENIRNVALKLTMTKPLKVEMK